MPGYNVSLTRMHERYLGRVDPALRALFDGVEPDEPDEPDRSADPRIARLLELLERLPPKERDILEMYYLRGKMQSEIAQIFRCTQAAICYRLKRATQRLRIMYSLPPVTVEMLRELLPRWFDGIDCQLLESFHRSGCQVETGRELGYSQGMARNRLLRARKKLRRLAAEDERYSILLEYFGILLDNLNILREVKLPQWAHQTASGVEP